MIPLAILGAVGFLALRGTRLGVFGWIGLPLLVGLAATNSTLLVSFAEELRRKGEDALEAAKSATPMRLRPVLTTCFAFILGQVPLAKASAAAADAPLSMTTAAMGGLLVATSPMMFVTPAFHVAAARPRSDRIEEGIGNAVAAVEPAASDGRECGAEPVH